MALGKLSEGCIYVMTNKMMPNIVKIGFSTSDPAIRRDQLSNHTVIPIPFDLVYRAWGNDYQNAERQVHHHLRSSRVSESREFFHVTPWEAIDVINERANVIEEHIDPSLQKPAKTGRGRPVKKSLKGGTWLWIMNTPDLSGMFKFGVGTTDPDREIRKLSKERVVLSKNEIAYKACIKLRSAGDPVRIIRTKVLGYLLLSSADSDFGSELRKKFYDARDINLEIDHPAFPTGLDFEHLETFPISLAEPLEALKLDKLCILIYKFKCLFTNEDCDMSQHFRKNPEEYEFFIEYCNHAFWEIDYALHKTGYLSGWLKETYGKHKGDSNGFKNSKGYK